MTIWQTKQGKKLSQSYINQQATTNKIRSVQVILVQFFLSEQLSLLITFSKNRCYYCLLLATKDRIENRHFDFDLTSSSATGLPLSRVDMHDTFHALIFSQISLAVRVDSRKIQNDVDRAKQHFATSNLQWSHVKERQFDRSTNYSDERSEISWSVSLGLIYMFSLKE